MVFVTNQPEEKIVKNLKFLTQLGLLTTATASLATQVNVNHLAPFASSQQATAVSINVNGNEVISNIEYQKSSGYLALTDTGVAPGEITLDVYTPPGAGTAAITDSVELDADTFYSVTAIGDGINQPLSLLPLVDPQTQPSDGHVMLRIIHAASFSVDITETAVTVRTDEGDLVNGLGSLLFGEATDFFELPAGTYDLNISSPDGSTRLIDIAPVDLPAGTVVNVYATGDGINQTLGIYAVFSDGTGTVLPLEGISGPEPTRVNVAHLAPFADTLENTAVSIDVNGGEVLSAVEYKQASGYLSLATNGTAPGNTLLEVFTPPGSDTPAIMAEVDLAAETDYTVVAIGDGFNQPLSLLPLVDDNSAPTAGHVKLRIVHSAPFAADLADTAVSIRTDDGDLVNGLTGVEFGQQSGFFEVPAGLYDLNVATPDGSTRLIDLAPVTLNAGDIVTVYAIGDGVNQELGFYAIFGDGSSATLATEPAFTTLTPGLNGSWYNHDTDGQGFFFEIFPELGTVFVAWFTYDTTFADGNETAVVGEPNHRWLTASGSYTGTTADLTVYLSEGGIFNQDNAVQVSEAGTMTVKFDGCRTANVSYDLDNGSLSGMIPLTRISGSTIDFCESLITNE